MAIASDALVRDKLYIGGEWVEPAGDGSIEVVNPTTEEVVGRVPEGTAEDADRAVQAAARPPSTPGRRRRPRSAPRFCAAIGAKLAERGEELAALITTELGMPIGLSQHDPGGAAHRDLLLDARAREGGRVGGGGRQLADRARAGRRGGRDHAVELPAPPDRQQGRPGARRRLHGGAEAERDRAAERVRARRDRRGGRPARRRVQPRDRHAARWWARRSSPTPRPTWSPSPAPRARGGGCPSWRLRRRSRCRSSSAASRRT